MKLNKKQKRTATIASMAALLAVVLGMGGQTFAKYYETTTTQSGNVTVAKWGVVANIQDEYENVDSAAKLVDQIYLDSNDKEVVSGVSGAVVAPGTSGALTLRVEGQPEVAAQVKYTFELDDVSVTNLLGVSYYPIQWTLTIGEGSSAATSVHRGEDAMDEINDKVTALSKKYAPNTNFETVSVKIGWKWAFDNTEDSYINDDYDTILGNAAADEATTYDGYTCDYELSYKLGVSIEQIKEF